MAERDHSLAMAQKLKLEGLQPAAESKRSIYGMARVSDVQNLSYTVRLIDRQSSAEDRPQNTA